MNKYIAAVLLGLVEREGRGTLTGILPPLWEALCLSGLSFSEPPALDSCRSSDMKYLTSSLFSGILSVYNTLIGFPLFFDAI